MFIERTLFTLSQTAFLSKGVTKPTVLGVSPELHRVHFLHELANGTGLDNTPLFALYFALALGDRFSNTFLANGGIVCNETTLVTTVFHAVLLIVDLVLVIGNAKYAFSRSPWQFLCLAVLTLPKGTLIRYGPVLLRINWLAGNTKVSVSGRGPHGLACWCKRCR
jgi:hypothetical protein